ncbi:hypothetical protein LZK73_21935 [Neorhizobium galegae]|nr:hypothetical protein LZK73_21935 [Neorhizobium galegae]
MSYPDYISPTEREIIDRILKRALAKDYYVSVYDGEEWALIKSNDLAAIQREVGATDCTTLKFRDASMKVVGSVLLVHGNDEDVVGDCSDNPATLALVDFNEPLVAYITGRD